MSTPIAHFLQPQAESLSDYGLEAKRVFAEHFVKNGDAYGAARLVAPMSMSAASLIAVNWPTDPGVMEIMTKIIDERGAFGGLPSKEEFALKLWGEADSARSATTKLDFYKLFATVMGYVEKPAEKATTNVNVAIVNKVMQVRRSGNDEEARARIAANQAKLINATA